ncbi:MAG: Asp-tRNA(Asn)/Glu-tRNA(Gln) amidotransferase GatCAB subunit B, partial [Micrococcaceae bacterium]|nr:Asp-tRNA(Asn)/Glu-tRNA(Gln) amidotransferase GatCAB subunit B [Micrococcaceae bacterium]
DAIEETIAAGATPAVARKWWMGEISRLAKNADVEPMDLGVTPATIIELNQLIEAKKINDKIARQVLEFVVAGEGTPTEIVEKRSLAVVNDDSALGAAIDDAMASMPDVVAKIKDGKVQAIGALIGPVMKATRGQADAGRVREIVLEKLGVEG